MSQQYEFNRYRDGRKMAQGVKVHATDETAAVTKARALFRPWDERDTLKLRVYVLAQNSKEAGELFRAGCGYLTEASAKKAKTSPEIDSYYSNLMKIYEFEEATTSKQEL